MINKKPELLSPAGSLESVYAAVANGADAIYLGGKKFNARNFANNFDLNDIEKICDFCHLRGVKVYITVNTLYKESELNEVIDFVASLYTIGVDALIIQDLGLAKVLFKYFPNFPLHASTQLTSNSLSDVNSLYELGFKKIVLSRELNLDEVKYIKENTKAEIETFVHGALCVSYSGQCIMSSMLGGRSGNRGRCAQTCRLPYKLVKKGETIKEGYLLSTKDIQTITILPSLIEAGIDSFKIEGRMKTPEYVAGVTAIYRKYIDLYFSDKENYSVDNEDIKDLLKLFNRGGFSEGYYNSYSGSEMMSIERPKSWGLKLGFVDTYNKKLQKATIRTREDLVPGDGIEFWTKNEPHPGTYINRPSKAGEIITIPLKNEVEKNDVIYKTFDKKLDDELKRSYSKDTRKKEIFAKLKVKKDENMSLNLYDNLGNFVFVTGETAKKAETAPLSKEKIESQILKMGSTPFKIVNLEIDVDNDIFVSISSLNNLRREASEKFEQALIKKSKRESIKKLKYQSKPNESIFKKKMNVLIDSFNKFNIAVTYPLVDLIYVELYEGIEKDFGKISSVCKYEGKKLYIALPRINRDNSYLKVLEGLKDYDFDGFLVRSIGEFFDVKNYNKKITIDYNLNSFNSIAIKFWKGLGANNITLSTELNIDEIKQIADKDCEMIGYGYLPLMVTSQCPIGNFNGEKGKEKHCQNYMNEEKFYLKDRKDVMFPVYTDCKNCVSYILNSKPLFTLKFFDEILDSPTGSLRLIFTRESEKDMKNILTAYSDMLKDYKNQSIDAKILIEEMGEKGSTKGHFFRGVE